MQRETDMSDYDSIDTDFGTKQTDRVTRIALQQLAAERKLRSDLTEEQKAEALRIGRIEFKSAGATRKR
jgi:hypothetical protein